MSRQSNCVCAPSSTRRECIEVRYGGNELGEECECVCHDEDDRDDRSANDSAVSPSGRSTRQEKS
jgi:hypothetical protein